MSSIPRFSIALNAQIALSESILLQPGPGSDRHLGDVCLRHLGKPLDIVKSSRQGHQAQSTRLVVVLAPDVYVSATFHQELARKGNVRSESASLVERRLIAYTLRVADDPS